MIFSPEPGPFRRSFSRSLSPGQGTYVASLPRKLRDSIERSCSLLRESPGSREAPHHVFPLVLLRDVPPRPSSFSRERAPSRVFFSLSWLIFCPRLAAFLTIFCGLTLPHASFYLVDRRRHEGFPCGKKEVVWAGLLFFLP